jgi:lauroyl/myristoyl acyltransferase
MVDNIDESALRFARLHRHGNSELVAHTIVDPSVTEQFRRLDNGKDGFILLVPHCAGAVLSSAGLHAFHPSTLLVREPRAPVRCQLMMEYVKKLGPDFILARNTPPATVMRQIMRALKNHRVVVGTTDVVNSGNDTVEVTAFGQRIFSPAWPARLSARLGVPILPGFIHMDNGNFVLLADEGFVAQDLQASTQRWMSSFERRFRQYPSDWVFMLDKHWSKVMANAAAAAKSRVTSSGISATAS